MGAQVSKLALHPEIRPAVAVAAAFLALHPKTKGISRQTLYFLATYYFSTRVSEFRKYVWPPRRDMLWRYAGIFVATVLVFAKLFMDASEEFEISDSEKRKKLTRIAHQLTDTVVEEEKRVSEESKRGTDKKGKTHKMITTEKLLQILIDTDSERLITKIGVDKEKSRFDDAIRLLAKTIAHDIDETISKTIWSRENKPDADGNPIPEAYQTGKKLQDMLEICKRVREHFQSFPSVMKALEGECKMKDLRKQVRGEQRWKLLRLLPYVHQVWRLYLANVVLRVFSSALPTIQLHYMAQIAKFATLPDGWNKIKDACTAVAALSLASQVIRIAQSYLSTSMRCASIAVIQKDLYAAILSQDMQYFDQNRVDEIMRTIYLPNAVLGMMIHTPLNLLSIVSRIVAHLSLLWTKSPYLTLLSVASLPVSVPMAMYSWSHMSWMWKRSYRRYREGYNITEVLSNIRTMRSFGRERREIQDYDNMQKAGAAMQFETNAMQEAISLLNSTVRQVIDITFMCFAGYLVQSKESGLRPEDMVILVDSAKSLSSSLSSLFSTLRQLTESVPKAEQLVNILESIPSIEARPKLQGAVFTGDSDTKAGRYKPDKLQGRIEFNNVHFHYPTRQDVKVLQGLSFSVEKGQVVALVGPSGSGKSSVVRLLQRFYPISKGTILLDGRDLTEYEPVALRQSIGVVSQEPILFNTTIRENLLYGVTDPISDEEVISALKKANAWGFVSKLPERLRTEVGLRGTKLSGGQKQRIAIARALLTKPQMLLLDEATSALDTHAEAKVQKALDEMIKEVGGTTLVIAHRLSTIRNADKIIVLEDGKNFEEGNHDQLLARNGIYTSLVRQQTTEMDSPRRAVTPTPDLRGVPPAQSDPATPGSNRDENHNEALKKQLKKIEGLLKKGRGSKDQVMRRLPDIVNTLKSVISQRDKGEDDIKGSNWGTQDTLKPVQGLPEILRQYSSPY